MQSQLCNWQIMRKVFLIIQSPSLLESIAGGNIGLVADDHYHNHYHDHHHDHHHDQLVGNREESCASLVVISNGVASLLRPQRYFYFPWYTCAGPRYLEQMQSLTLVNPQSTYI